MQNLITANSVNTALDEAAASLNSGSSNNFTSRISSNSESGEKFSKIFKDTTRRQNEAAASTANAANTTNTKNARSTTNAANTMNTANTTSTTSTSNITDTTDTTDTANTTTPTNTTNNNDIKEAEAPEIKKCAAQTEIAVPAIPVTPEIQAEVEPVVEVDDQLNLNELNEVKAPEILIMQASVPVQEDVEVVADDAETTITPSQSEEISNLEVDSNTKDAVIKTATTKEEQKPVQSETQVQGQNIVRDVDVVQDENNQDQSQTVSREVQPKTQEKNQAAEQQPQSKDSAMEIPQEAVVETKADTLFVDENDIVNYEGEVVQIEQPQTKKSEDTTHIKAIDKNIIDELEAKVEQVIVAPQTQTQANNGKVLNSTLSASEQVVKLSIEDALTIKSDKNTQDAGADDLLNSGKQDFSPETFKLHSGTSVHNNANSAAGTTFDEALKNDVLNQIGTKFEHLKQDGGVGKITLALRPLDLGRVVIELTQTASGVTTNIIAQNSSVKELLEKNIEVLKQQLVQAGVNVQNINVKSADSAENSEQREHGEHHQEERQERQDQGGSNSGQKNNKDSEKEE